MTNPEGSSESTVSYVQIGGLVLSVLFAASGIVAYYIQTGGFELQFNPQTQMTGPDFFTYASSLVGSLGQGLHAAEIMSLGVVLLLLTSYARVFATLVTFTLRRNLKYAAISLFVFLVLTLALTFY